MHIYVNINYSTFSFANKCFQYGHVLVVILVFIVITVYFFCISRMFRNAVEWCLSA